MGTVVQISEARLRLLRHPPKRGDDLHHGGPDGVVELAPDVDKQKLLSVMHKLAVSLGVRDRGSILRPARKVREINIQGGGNLPQAP